MVYGLPSEADQKKCLNRTENSSVRFFILILLLSYFLLILQRMVENRTNYMPFFYPMICFILTSAVGKTLKSSLSVFFQRISQTVRLKRYQIFSLQQCRTGRVAVCLPATWPGIIHFRKEHIILLSIKKTERKKEEEKSDCKRHTQTALQ